MVGLLCAAGAVVARGETYAGDGWAVHFNRPDQTTSLSSIGGDEFVIRDALLARIEALGSGDWGALATFTFSGSTAAGGAAGPILEAVQRALERGAQVGFAVDKSVSVTSNYWPGVSLDGLAHRASRPLELASAPSDNGIMHHKVGVFWYGAARKGWVLAGSWNFTGGASSQQWNILTEIQNNELAAAYSNEMRELLSGRFHAHAAKSHAPDGTRFRMAGSDRDGWVRFAPYPDGKYGGTNALTDIIEAIDGAEDEIFFALNKLTRQGVVDALIRACNRGVTVHGVIPQSDRSLPGQDSYDMHQMLIQPTNYATRNRVRMYEAYYDAVRTRYDNGSRDLVHAKYMVIDPRGVHPLVIQGSANWTASALVLTSSNDENIQFLPHRGMAEAFTAHFAALSDGMLPWCGLGVQGSGMRLDYWLPETNRYELVFSGELQDPGAWTNLVQALPTGRGTNALMLPRDAAQRFYRIRQAP